MSEIVWVNNMVKKFAFIVLIFAVSLPLSLSFANNEISVKEAYKLSSSDEVILIDIRSEDEWKSTGIASTAVPISMHQSGGAQAFSNQLLTYLEGDKTKPIALICAGGVRSSRMQTFLLSQGYSQVINVKEGMQGGWVEKGWLDHRLPVKNYKNQSAIKAN
jgi:rhodanese-related sulfurtransferase